MSRVEHKSLVEDMARFWPTPWTATRPVGEEMVQILDAYGRTIMRLEWPFHGEDDADAAEQSTYALANQIAALSVLKDRLPADELSKRLCDLHSRLSLCFQGAQGEPPPRRPHFFEPKWDDMEVVLDAAVELACAADRITALSASRDEG